MYKDWKMNIKNLSDLLWSYSGALDRNDLEEMYELRPKVLELFDQLTGPEENANNVKEIRNNIVRDMNDNSFDDIEVARYTRDLVFYGYK